MTLARFCRNNATPLVRLQGEMGDLFDGFFRGLDRPFTAHKAWPAIDVAEQDDAIVVRAEVPGSKPDEIDISVYGNTLTISGEKKETKQEKDKGYYHTESVHGTFRREINLPTDVDNAKVKAAYKDGVLTITLPRAEASKAVKVQVEQN
jgi:HSP20 family protein